MKQLSLLAAILFTSTALHGAQPTPTPTWQQWFSSWVPWAQYHWQNVQNIYNTQGFEEVCKTYPTTTAVLTLGVGCAVAYYTFGYNSLENQLMRAVDAADLTKIDNIIKELAATIKGPEDAVNSVKVFNIYKKALAKAHANVRSAGDNETDVKKYNDVIVNIQNARDKLRYIETPRSESGPVIVISNGNEDNE
jgi:hypothetical protein